MPEMACWRIYKPIASPEISGRFKKFKFFVKLPIRLHQTVQQGYSTTENAKNLLLGWHGNKTGSVIHLCFRQTNEQTGSDACIFSYMDISTLVCARA